MQVRKLDFCTNLLLMLKPLPVPVCSTWESASPGQPGSASCP